MRIAALSSLILVLAMALSACGGSSTKSADDIYVLFRRYLDDTGDWLKNARTNQSGESRTDDIAKEAVCAVLDEQIELLQSSQPSIIGPANATEIFANVVQGVALNEIGEYVGTSAPSVFSEIIDILSGEEAQEGGGQNPASSGLTQLRTRLCLG